MIMMDDPKQHLLDIAGQKFAEKGFDATNVREITEAAGMNVASVNYHFGSKEELYLETVRNAARMCEQITPMPVWEEGVPAEERLRDYIRSFLTRILREDVPTWHRKLIMREVAEPRPGGCEVFVHSFVKPSFEVLQGILRDLTPPGTPIESLHLIGSSIVGQVLHYHHARNVMKLLFSAQEFEQMHIERLTEHIWRFSLGAIRSMFPRKNKGEGR